MTQVKQKAEWSAHLNTSNGPLVHFVQPHDLQVSVIQESAEALGLQFFKIDAALIDSKDSLFGAFAQKMHFPSYFGWGWDALFDLTCDLAWYYSQGFVLLFYRDKALLDLAPNDFRSLVEIVEAACEFCQQDSDTPEKRQSVPFHAVFVGGQELRQAILQTARSPVCSHSEIIDDMVETIMTWKEHFRAENSSRLHFMPTGSSDIGWLAEGARHLGFATFAINDILRNPPRILFQAFDREMSLPVGVAQDWNSLRSSLMDLSWCMRRGFVLLLENLDFLFGALESELRTLVHIAEDTTKCWRDDRGEFGERKGPVPFHVIFSGSPRVYRLLSTILTEKVCIHNHL